MYWRERALRAEAQLAATLETEEGEKALLLWLARERAEEGRAGGGQSVTGLDVQSLLRRGMWVGGDGEKSTQ